MTTCAHCFHSGPVHASSLEPRLAPRIWCDDCAACRQDSESRGLPLQRVRMSHVALLRVLVEAESGRPVTQAEAAAAYERHSTLWTAPEDHLDSVAGDLAEWNLVDRDTGVAHPLHPGLAAPVYDGSWSARTTEAGRDLQQGMRSIGR